MRDDQMTTTPYHWQRRTIVSAIAAALAPGWVNTGHAQDQNEERESTASNSKK